MKENRKLLREVLKDIRRDMTDEEVLNLLADSKISENLAGEKEKYTLSRRAADAIVKFAGSWEFIFSFTGVLILWMLVNTLLAAKAFDPYPFIPVSYTHLDVYKRQALRIDGASLKRILSIGLPAGVQSAVFSFANIVIQSAINLSLIHIL